MVWCVVGTCGVRGRSVCSVCGVSVVCCVIVCVVDVCMYVCSVCGVLSFVLCIFCLDLMVKFETCESFRPCTHHFWKKLEVTDMWSKRRLG